MGRKLDPTRKEKRGPGRKARKQRGAEVELARFLPPGKSGPGPLRPGPARPGGAGAGCPDRCVSLLRAGDRQEEALQSREEEVRAARAGRGGGGGGRAGADRRFPSPSRAAKRRLGAGSAPAGKRPLGGGGGGREPAGKCRARCRARWGAGSPPCPAAPRGVPLPPGSGLFLYGMGQVEFCYFKRIFLAFWSLQCQAAALSEGQTSERSLLHVLKPLLTYPSVRSEVIAGRLGR